MVLNFLTSLTVHQTPDRLEVRHDPILIRWGGAVVMLGAAVQLLWSVVQGDANRSDLISAGIMALLGMPLTVLASTRTLVADAASRRLVVKESTCLTRREEQFTFDEVKDIVIDGETHVSEVSNEAMPGFEVWLVLHDGRRTALSADLSASRDEVRQAVSALRRFIVPQNPPLE